MFKVSFNSNAVIVFLKSDTDLALTERNNYWGLRKHLQTNFNIHVANVQFLDAFFRRMRKKWKSHHKSLYWLLYRGIFKWVHANFFHRYFFENHEYSWVHNVSQE